MVVLMRSRLFWRRSAAAAGTYASAALGFFGTVVALHVFSTETFGRYALVLAATSFIQSLLDLTVEEALVKFGFRYTERQDWGRLRRLFESAIAFKLLGGVLATGLLLGLAPVANSVLHKSGLTTALTIGAFLPLAQCTENVGGVAILLRGRYDVRAFFCSCRWLFASRRSRSALRAGSRRLSRPSSPRRSSPRPRSASPAGSRTAASHSSTPPSLGRERRDILSFVAQSSAATAVISLTAPLSLLVLGRVASTRQVAFFRAAMSPQQAFAVVSAPARLILLTEQDACVGARHPRRRLRGDSPLHGRDDRGLGGDPAGAARLHPRAREAAVLGEERRCRRRNTNRDRRGRAADGLRLDEVVPRVDRRPALRIWAHGIEMVVLIPLVGVLGAKWGATGAATAVLVSSVAFCLVWSVFFVRIRREPAPAPTAGSPLEAALP